MRLYNLLKNIINRLNLLDSKLGTISDTTCTAKLLDVHTLHKSLLNKVGCQRYKIKTYHILVGPSTNYIFLFQADEARAELGIPRDSFDVSKLNLSVMNRGPLVSPTPSNLHYVGITYDPDTTAFLAVTSAGATSRGEAHMNILFVYDSRAGYTQ